MLSVLIVNWNTRHHLQKCLQSIFRHPPHEACEVIVVDNASTDGSAQMVEEEFPHVKLIASPTNTGYAKGNNLAFAQASGEWLLTLNPDTEMFEDTLDQALTVLREHGDVGYLGIKQIGTDGRVQSSVRGFPTARGIIGMLTGVGRRRPGSIWDSYRLSAFDYEREGPAPQPMGTFLLFRRAALEEAGNARSPLDERFPIFFNEVDLLYRLQKRGWKGWYTPRAAILHHGGESTRQVRKSMIWESHKSLSRYMWKHHGTGIGVVGLPFVSAAIYIAAFIRAKGYDAGFRPRA